MGIVFLISGSIGYYSHTAAIEHNEKTNYVCRYSTTSAPCFEPAIPYDQIAVGLSLSGAGIILIMIHFKKHKFYGRGLSGLPNEL